MSTHQRPDWRTALHPLAQAAAAAAAAAAGAAAAAAVAAQCRRSQPQPLGLPHLNHACIAGRFVRCKVGT